MGCAFPHARGRKRTGLAPRHAAKAKAHRLVCAMHRHRCGRFMHMPPADLELMTLHASAVALARSMRGEPDARRFVESLSEHLRQISPHDRLRSLPEAGPRAA